MSRTDTEATCEVVKVREIVPHPGFYNKKGEYQPADKLDIVKFEFASGIVPDYQVVVRKGEYQPGNLAVYISDDMLVPVDRPEFVFTKGRLDYKQGSMMYRVRAARLRGEISTGMLVNPKDISGNRDTISIGMDMTARLGVEKYESPADKAAGERADDVPAKTWLDRLKRKLADYLFKPFRAPEYTVTAIRKVPNYFKEGEPVIFTEKVHGANIRFGKHRGKVYIGSHRSEKSDRRNWLVRKLYKDRRGPGWYGHDMWSEWFYRTFSNRERLAELPDNIIFYGELYGPGVQGIYDYGLKETDVLVFDAYDTKEKRWLSYIEVINMMPSFLRFVTMWRVLDFTKAHLMAEVERDSIVGPSNRPNIIREGIVVRSLDWERAGKYVSQRYLESKRD